MGVSASESLREVKCNDCDPLSKDIARKRDRKALLDQLNNANKKDDDSDDKCKGWDPRKDICKGPNPWDICKCKRWDGSQSFLENPVISGPDCCKCACKFG